MPLLILWNGGIPCIQILHTKDRWSTLKIVCIVTFLSPFRKLFTYKQLFNRPPLPPLNIPFPSKSRNMAGGRTAKQKLSFMVHLEDTANSIINDILMIMNEGLELWTSKVDLF